MNVFQDLKRNGWIWQITMLSLILGMLLAAALKTQQHIKVQAGVSTGTRAGGLFPQLLAEKENSKRLQGEINDLRSQISKYEQTGNADTSKTEALKKEIQKAKFLAGLSPAEGAGVEVTLQDSTKRPPADEEQVLLQEYIIHDLDLRNFVNELIANGAETISIKDKDSNQRIIASSSIRCVGAVIRVNGVAMSPPFTICAIGPPDVLAGALKMRDGIIDQFRMVRGISNDMVKVKKRDHIVMPAYSGSTRFIYSAPVDSEERSE